jgi:hypothetical protein
MKEMNVNQKAIEPANRLTREDMKNVLRSAIGGTAPVTGDYNCSTTTSHGYISITNSSASLVAAWADFWTTAGYSVSCTQLNEA